MNTYRIAALAALLVGAALAGCNCGTAPCAETGCEGGQVCDATTTACRDAVACADLDCALHQLCVEGDAGEDAACAAACDPGYDWDGDGCIESPTGCALCTAENRACEADGSCGDCADGFVEDATSSCVPYATCETLPAEGSIAAQCQTENRVCNEAAEGFAECGACLPTYVDVNDVCEEQVTCATLAASCTTLNRTCSDDPNGHCDACVQGYVPDDASQPEAGGCRLPRTCDDIRDSCTAQGLLCVQPPDLSDAYCAEDCETPGGEEGVTFPGGECAVCPPCNNVGENGPYLLAVSLEDKCICETAPGYYYDLGVLRAQACDEDGDGWVRINAEPALTSPAGSAEKANARCQLRTIDRVVVQNVVGEERTVGIPATPLYESERNDSQAKMQQATDGQELPTYGEGGRFLATDEVNSFTKACASANADFNDNGVDDVAEFHEQTGVDDRWESYVPFTYFVELYRGFYVAPTSGPHGSYRIVEKSRVTGAPDAVAFDAPEQQIEDVGGDGGTIAGEYWRTCPAFQDPAYVTQKNANLSRAGFDFAELDDSFATWRGANHHSQFRCLVVATSRVDADPLNKVTPAMVGGAEDYALNECTAQQASSGPPAGADPVNPSDPVISCVPDTSVESGDVGFAVVEYKNRQDGAAYQGGCVNECTEFPEDCPGYDPERPNQSQCTGDFNNYGKLFCGCGENYAGPDCELACPDRELLLDPDLSVAPRRGFWLCGDVAASEAPLLHDATDGGYQLRGYVPAAVVPTTPLCAVEGCATGYSIR